MQKILKERTKNKIYKARKLNSEVEEVITANWGFTRKNYLNKKIENFKSNIKSILI